MRCLVILALILIADSSFAQTIGPPEAVDGDTARDRGVLYRLVGFDAPETFQARCPAERDLGNRATVRLRQLIAGGGTVLDPVPCSCRPGTEGTAACNHGRLCAILWVRQKDVAGIMIREGLARPYVCSRTKCPKREGWCG